MIVGDLCVIVVAAAELVLHICTFKIAVEAQRVEQEWVNSIMIRLSCDFAV